jgi:substrate-binding family protein
MTSSPTRWLLRGYGPLLALAVLFVLMAAFVPTVGEQVRTVATGDAGGGLPSEAGLTPGAEGADAVGGEGAAAGPGSASAGRAGSSGGGRPGTAAAGSSGSRTAISGPAAARGSATGAVRPCPNRKVQVPNDPYSPPCYAFSGNNGGATSKGVSGDTIVVSARFAGLPDLSAAPSTQGPGQPFSIKPEEIKRTITALADYFNSRFQFYGRKLKVEFFDGKGSFTTELQGGGQEQVEADAVKAAEEIKAFAELIGFTAPYDDALARRKVLSFGAPYMSREWMAERRPYTWSPATDCTFIQETVTDWAIKRLVRKPAVWAGGALKGKERSFAVIAPEQPWYQQCVNAGDRVLQKNGLSQKRIAYKLDFATLSNQAASVIAKLRSEGITTVVCGCDPAFPIFLTSKAQEQGYEPEWIITGAALVDVDVLGQLYQQDQWSRAFGVSFLGPMQPIRGTLGYAAYKLMRPNDEPSPLVDIFYYNMYLLAIGLQMAGPNLTPENFERGMFAYPGGSGLAGTWKFLNGRYTPQLDAREIYWDRNKTSVQNNEKGAYVESEPGRRYRPGQWPSGDPRVFRAE